jgi:hypothetical protein
VNRFVADERPGVARHFAELFGTDEAEHQAAASLSGEERKSFLRDLYMRQLHDVGGFTYVRSFELMDVERRRTAYFLMFGTRHHKGLEVIKDAMWALDPVSGVRFTGFAGDQQMLFETQPNMAPLRAAILEQFAGMTASVEEIERFVIEETDYKTTQYKRAVLKELEEDGVIFCGSQRQRRLTYPPGTILRFGSGNPRRPLAVAAATALVLLPRHAREAPSLAPRALEAQMAALAIHSWPWSAAHVH